MDAVFLMFFVKNRVFFLFFFNFRRFFAPQPLVAGVVKAYTLAFSENLEYNIDRKQNAEAAERINKGK